MVQAKQRLKVQKAKDKDLISLRYRAYYIRHERTRFLAQPVFRQAALR
jgi:hypothetical protein